MPKITITDTPRLVYKAKNAVWTRPARILARADDTDPAVRVWAGPNDDVTVGGTDDTTDGVYFDAGEPYTDSLIAGDAVYMVVATGSVDLYYTVTSGN